MGAALFKRAGTKGQVSRRASAFVEEGSSASDNLVDVSSHTSSADISDTKNGDQSGSDDHKTKNGKEGLFFPVFITIFFHRFFMNTKLVLVVLFCNVNCSTIAWSLSPVV